MKKRISLRKRWLSNTLAITVALGLVCSLAITALFATFCYNDRQEELESQASNAAAMLYAAGADSYEEYVAACTAYVENYTVEGTELQFIDATNGRVVTGSSQFARKLPGTEEIESSINYRKAQTFVGTDPGSGAMIMAVSHPLIYSNGDVVGVLRFVTGLTVLNWRIGAVAGGVLLLAALLITVTLVLGNAHIRSILDPMQEITEKAKRIAGGAYGMQIKTRHNDEIGELAETISDLSAQVARNEKMQTEFISSLSHELRTPLTAITGWSETLLSDDTLDPDTQRGVKIISREAKRLTEMVVDLLDFTRMQDGRMTLNVETADIRAEFEDTVFMYSSRLSQDGVVLDYLENNEDVPEITCDSERLRQVFLNILDNAAKHGGEGKRIEASIHYEDGNVVVRIRDFGPGIPEDEIPLVKRKFYKGSSKARGSGIGLAVCDEIVQMHNGELILSNAEGGGTLVTVRLPASQ